MTHLHDTSIRSQRLLLLPPPPSDLTIASFRAAYAPALARVLRDAAPQTHSGVTSCVDIAVLCSHLEGQELLVPRSASYQTSQKVLAVLYRLYVCLCAEGIIDQEQEDKIDIRIVLVTNDSTSVQGDQAQATRLVPQGPVISCQALAQSERRWTDVYAVESELGESFLQSFIKYRQSLPHSGRTSHFTLSRVPGGTTIKIVKSTEVGISNGSGRRHYSVAVGGTFDHLHVGHRLLLTATALALDPLGPGDKAERSLTVGITGDELLKNKKFAEVLEKWEERQAAVYEFLSSIMFFSRHQEVKEEKIFTKGPNGKAVHYTLEDGLVIKCVEIQDPFGPTITEECISSLVISRETRSGGKAVNNKRTEKGWAALEIFEVDVLDANSEEDSMTAGTDEFQSKISSSEIRRRLQQKLAAVL